MLDMIARWIHPQKADATAPRGCAPAPVVSESRRTPPTRSGTGVTSGPLVVDIKGNSLDDGPGIRTVVFLKGCPLECVWCHNPETRSAKLQLSFTAPDCLGCASCVAACPESAIALDRPERIDRASCTLCGDCAAACPARALSLVGRSMTVEAVVAAVVKDKPFFDASGGGLTLSGGEPTQHMAFAAAILRTVREEGVHTLVETCGLFSLDRFLSEMLPWLDSVYFDLKLIEPGAHRRFCGVSNEVILTNFARLHALSGEMGFELLPRTPLVPGITAAPENLEGIATYLEGLGVNEARLLPYNPTWQDKVAQLGATTPASDTALPTTWMPAAEVEACADIFERHGINVREGRGRERMEPSRRSNRRTVDGHR